MSPLSPTPAPPLVEVGDAPAREEGAVLAELYLDTGRTFRIDRLSHDGDVLDLAVPLEVCSRSVEPGIEIWCDELRLYGVGMTAQDAYRDLSGVFIGAVEVFCREDSPVPQLKRMLEHHTEGVRCPSSYGSGRRMGCPTQGWVPPRRNPGPR